MDAPTALAIETTRQVGPALGIENYPSHIDGRGPGHAARDPARLFPRGFLLVNDESHATVPRRSAAVREETSPQAQPGVE